MQNRTKIIAIVVQLFFLCWWPRNATMYNVHWHLCNSLSLWSNCHFILNIWQTGSGFIFIFKHSNIYRMRAENEYHRSNRPNVVWKFKTLFNAKHISSNFMHMCFSTMQLFLRLVCCTFILAVLIEWQVKITLKWWKVVLNRNQVIHWENVRWENISRILTSFEWTGWPEEKLIKTRQRMKTKIEN